MTFKKVKEERANDKFVVEEFIHEKTGAKHIHINVEGGEKAFAISFNTPVNDDKGLPHIIEHLVLNGSKKYPVENMFLHLGGKNLESYLNAMTDTTETTYLFSANVDKGFDNLTDVMLDAVFNPLLTKKSFLTEGFRLELGESGELKFSGVVYNEMMGHVGSVPQALNKMNKDILGKNNITSYTGGDPVEIAGVKYEDVLSFHKKYYHPSNSTVFTVGDMNLNDLHNNLNNYFNKFEKSKRLKVEDVNVELNGFHKVAHSGAENYINLKLDLGDISAREAANIEITIALINKYLSNYFENNSTELEFHGVSVSSLNNKKIMDAYFKFEDGVENIEEKAAKIRVHWHNALESILKSGVDKNILETLVKHAKSTLKKDFSEGYAINTIHKLLKNEFEQKKPYHEAFLNTDTIEEEYRLFKDPKTIENIIRKYFINDKFAIGLAYSDSSVNEKYLSKIKEMEYVVNAIHSNQETREKIGMEFKTLEDVSSTPDVLPELNTNDIIPVHESLDGVFQINTKLNGAKIHFYDIQDDGDYTTVGLSYNFVPRTEEELVFEILQTHFVSSNNFKNMTAEEKINWLGTDLISFKMKVSQILKNNVTEIFQSLSVKGFRSNIDKVIDVIEKANTIQDFNDKDKFKQLLSSSLSGFYASSSNMMHQYASMMNLVNLERNSLMYIDDVKIISYMSKYLSEMENGDFSVFDRFKEYYYSEARKNNKAFDVFINGNKDDAEYILDKLVEINHLGKEKTFNENDLNKIIEKEVFKNNLLIADTASAFTAVTYPLDLQADDDVSKLKLGFVSEYFKNIALNHLRVDLGVYSVFSMIETSGLTVVSYRTPNPVETVEYCKNLAHYILESGVDENVFEGTKKEMLSKYVKYSSKEQVLGKHIQYRLLNRDYFEYKEMAFKTIKEMTKEDMLENITKHLLKNEHLVTVVNGENISEDFKTENVIVYPSMEKYESKNKKALTS